MEIASRVFNIQRATSPPDTLPSDSFPARYFSTSIEEENLVQKRKYLHKLAESLGNGTKVHTYYDYKLIADEIADLRSKENETIQYSVHEFVSNAIKPTTRQDFAAEMNRVFPEYRQARLDWIDFKWDLLTTIASWKVKSRFNRDDFMLLYCLAQMKTKERSNFLDFLLLDWYDKTKPGPDKQKYERIIKEQLEKAGKLRNPEGFLTKGTFKVQGENDRLVSIPVFPNGIIKEMTSSFAN